MYKLMVSNFVGIALLFSGSAYAAVSMPEIPDGQDIDFVILGTGVLGRGGADDPDNTGEVDFFKGTEGVLVDIRFSLTRNTESNPYYTYEFDVTRRDNGRHNPTYGWGLGEITDNIFIGWEEISWWGFATHIIFDLDNPGGSFELNWYVDPAWELSGVNGTWEAWRITSEALQYDSYDPELERQWASIPSIPEPASWALMISGFGLTGLAFRRQRRATA